MAGSLAPSLLPIVVGANHRSSSLALRDRLFVEDPMIPAFLAGLKETGLGDAMVLSTCDRVEVHCVHEDPVAAEAIVLRNFSRQTELPGQDARGQLYMLHSDDAVRHIFRVAASLESQVIGEPQVLGQIKAAHRIARDAQMIDGLEPILQAAYSAAKRVRTETAIGERPVSIAAAAVQVAHDVQGELERSRGILIGDGDMGELVASHLLNAGLGLMTVLHHTPERASGAARRLSCHAAAMEDLADEMAQAEIVITAVGRREHSLSSDMVRAAVTRRRRKPVFIVDLALPGDVDPAVNRIDEAFLYDLSDLERIAMEGMSHRENAAEHAAQIIEQELLAFSRSRSERAAVPVLGKLRQHVEAMREEALADAGGDAEKATHLLINRLLHDPSVVLREIAASSDDSTEPNSELRAVEAVVERLFRLHQNHSHPSPDDTEDGD